jgi:5-methyltetrahydrofolate--homocysteine methyltransferase
MAKLTELADFIIKGNAPETEKLTKELLDSGTAPGEVLNGGLIKGMEEVGRRFKANEFYVPEVLIAARAMKAGMTLLKPKLVESGVEPIAKVVVGTVKGDLHDIGKNLVAMMLEGSGYEVIDVGVDVSAEKFVQTAKEEGAHAIGMSALLTTTMINMGDVVKELNNQGMSDSVKVIIGGAPVTQNYADEIGANGYAADAASAVEILQDVLGLN